jgi:hypothetical protein
VATDIARLIRIRSDGEAAAFGNSGAVVYRATVDGVRFTGRLDNSTGTAWVVQHAGHTTDSDGRAIARTTLLRAATGELERVWNAIRSGTVTPLPEEEPKPDDPIG